MFHKQRRKVISAAIAVIYVIRRRRKRKLIKAKRRFWVRPIFRNKSKSEFHNLVQELLQNDREYHYR